jgi:spermidine synthase
MAKGFDSPKLKLHIGDGFEFLNKHKNEFDVIITDSSDPEGERETLNQQLVSSIFMRSFFKLLYL